MLPAGPPVAHRRRSGASTPAATSSSDLEACSRRRWKAATARPPASRTTRARRRPWPTRASARCSRPSRATSTRATGVIQWMLNNAWPSMIWHLYDYYLRPGGGYFGTKKACEPLHVQYSYDDRSVVVVNDRQEACHGPQGDGARPRPRPGAEVLARGDGGRAPRTAWCAPSRSRRSKGARRRRTSCGSTSTDAAGTPVSTNFYWLATRDDVLDWEKTKWFYTPVKRHADLTALAPAAAHRRSRSCRAVRRRRPRAAARVTVENTRHGAGLPGAPQAVGAADGGDERLPVLLGRQLLRAVAGREARGPGGPTRRRRRRRRRGDQPSRLERCAGSRSEERRETNYLMVGLVFLIFFVISLLTNILGPLIPDIISGFLSAWAWPAFCPSPSSSPTA